ncbi:sensor histidine kinase WalK [bacterium MnTg02]|nr:sensor histidine kinase WalK [bacterium MnTg02]
MALSSDSHQLAGQSEQSRPPLNQANKLTFVIGLVIVLASLAAGFATYAILTGLTPIIPTHGVVVTMLLVNVVLVLAMIGVITWQVRGLWIARRRQAAGSLLHTRIVGMFSIIAVLPAIILAVFASISLDRGLDQWFSSRTKSIINNSVNVALAYVREHGQVIRSDILSIAKDLEGASKLVKVDSKRMTQFLTAQAAIRSLPEAYLVNGKGEIVSAAKSRVKSPYVAPPKRAIELAKDGKAIVIAPGSKNLVGAVKKLENFPNAYIYVLRAVNPKVIRHLKKTRASVQEFRQLEERRVGVQVAFALMFTAIALTLLLAAIWLGLWLANRLVSPIRKLISAAQQVSEGNLNVQLTTQPGEGDLGQLSSTFNKMTMELRSQRDDLVDANSMLDDRRRFMEAVLSGVTAGVIGIDSDGRVSLANRSALELLSMEEADLVGKNLSDSVTELAPLLEQARNPTENSLVQDHIDLVVKGDERNFAVRVTRDRPGEKDYGFVVTFDDITELVNAQRTSAWADVARRIAHEIKNPLTPIQLSADRLRRKYGAVIGEDREVFDQCTDTIIRHVGDIGRMVDEFSSFARMPKPVMEQCDIRDVVRDAVILFQMSNSEIKFEIDTPDKPVISYCDRRLLSQAVTNLVKNASEAIAAATDESKGENSNQGLIVTRLVEDKNRFAIEVVDNGCGFPKKNRNRLVEPYMTTREKGTGLGLAIVQKITEQHGGTIRLEDAPKRNGVKRGACVRISVPIAETARAAKAFNGTLTEQEKTAEPDYSTSSLDQGVTDGV